MAPLALLLCLAAAPDAGVAPTPAWTVTFETSVGSDDGDGRIDSTSEVTTVITPVDVRQSAEGTRKGQTTKNVMKARPLAAEVRDAITALLPKLPAASAAFSISLYVDDEGWNSARLEVMRGGKTVNFELVQGKSAPSLPEALVELRKLVGAALKPPR